MLSIFLCAFWTSMCLWRSLCLGFPVHFLIGLFFHWVVETFCIFWKLSHCAIVHKYFLPFHRLSFCFVCISFAVQKLVIGLHTICLFLFLLSWETDLRKHCYNLCQRIFCLLSFLGVLWCLVLYKSLRDFELICMHSVRACSNFFDLYAAVQLSQHHVLKRLSFLHFIFLPSLSKINWP